MRVAMLGPFGLSPRMTMRARAFQLARELVEKGHPVSLIMPPWHTPDQAGRRWTEDGVEIEYVSLSPNVPVARDLAVSARLVQRALAFRPDVVHVFKPIGHAGLAARYLHETSRLSSRHAALAVDQDDWEGRGGWHTGRGGTPAGKSIVAAQERWALGHASAVTVASRALQTLAWSLGAPPAAVHHLPNGPRAWRAGDGAAVRQRLGLADHSVVLLYTRFFEFDVDRVADEFGQVRAAIPDARLLVVGTAMREADGQRFEAAIARLGLADAVVHAGWVPEEDLPDYLAAANAAVYPFDDNLLNRTKCPVKLTDLLYCGVPVAAENVGEMGEYVRHRETGLLVPAESRGALAAAAIELLQNREVSSELARCAAETMRSRYSWATRSEQLLDIYEELIASRGGQAVRHQG